MLTLAFLIKLGFPLMSVTQISSLVPAFLCVLITGWWGQRRFGVVWGSLAALALALSQSFSYWGRSGMETPAFALFILLALIAAAEGQWRVMGLSACLIAVTRPEGIIYLVPLFAHAAMVVWRDNRTLKDLVVPVLLAVAPLAAWVLFRLVYFHEILPNTYYAKMDGMRLAQVQRGLEYLYGFLRISEIQVLQLLILAMLIVEIVRRRGRPSRDWIYSWQVLGAGMMVCTVVFVLSSGGDWMNQHRFTQPTLPVFILMGVAAGFALGNAPSGKVTKLLTTLMLALVFASQPVRVLSHDLRHPVHPLDRALGLVEPWDDSTTSNLYRLGLSMREVAPPGTTIALCPVGAFSVAWGGTVIDMLGLNDREIAKLPLEDMGKGQMGHEKGNGKVVLSRRPDFILLRNNPNPDPGKLAPPDQELNYLVPVIQIWNDTSFKREYEPMMVEIGDHSFFTIYRRIAGN